MGDVTFMGKIGSAEKKKKPSKKADVEQEELESKTINKNKLNKKEGD